MLRLEVGDHRPKSAQPSPDSPCGKFRVFMRKLVQIPKAELEQKLSEERMLKPKRPVLAGTQDLPQKRRNPTEQ
jgi:hypothetical protein